MRVVVGLFIFFFGGFFAVSSERLSRFGGVRQAQTRGMRTWNRTMFVVIGGVLSLCGLAYAFGVVG
ncbi:MULTISPECIES: hypothetical protein [unclassified Streptomyces]|uniref:hypothetical protein n=1 Tax=unclassified Streptomyces TaxID=2593676 RepID=UPI00380B24C7